MSKNIVLQSQQQVAYNLSLTVTRRNDDRLELLVLPILSLSWLIMFYWQSQVIFNQVGFSLLTLKEIVIVQLDLHYKVFSIVFNSLFWAMVTR